MTSVFVECKKTDKVDFVKPLRKYIVSEFGKESSEQYANAIDKLTLYREDLRLNTERTEATRDKYIHYLQLLRFTKQHFPIGEQGIRINFYWYDSVSKKRASQYGTDYEEACIKFNIGAIESQIAFLHNRSSADGVKLACKFYQMAAGTFSSLAEFTRQHSHLAGTPDLNGDYLSLLSFMMLGQAQECFFEKAQTAGMKSNILFKLAGQVHEYYYQASRAMDSPALKPSIQKYWPVFVKLRGAMHQSLAYYHRSVEFLNEDKYGAQVGCLAVACACLQNPDIEKVLKGVPVQMQQQCIEVTSLVTKAYQTANYDNSKIYHEPVAQAGELEKKAMVRPISQTLPEPSPQDNPFRGLLSKSVVESNAACRSAIGSKVQELSQTVQENDQFARSSLASMNLPSSVQNLNSTQTIPPPLQSRIQKFKDAGGIAIIASSIDNAKSLSQEAETLLNQSKTILKEEETLDTSMRQKHGSQWVLPASHLVNSKYFQEISKYDGNLTHAKKSDAIVQGKFNNIAPVLQKLSGFDSDLNGLIPKDDEPSANTKDCARQIMVLLQKLEDIIAERKSIMQQANAIGEADVSAAFAGGDLDRQSVIEKEISKLEPFSENLVTNGKAQSSLLQEICDVNQLFINSKSSTGNSRDDAIKRVGECLDICQELLKNLGECANFYRQFCGILNTLKGNCSSYANDRKGAKLALESKLSSARSGQQQFVPSAGTAKYYQAAPPQQQQQQQQAPSYRQAAPSYRQAAPSYQPQQPPTPYTPNSFMHNPTQPQYRKAEAAAPPPQYIQVAGPDGKIQFIPASSVPYYQPPK